MTADEKKMKRSALMLVDDDAGVLSSLRRLFLDEGYSVVLATGAVEALALLDTEQVAVMLTDLRMPTISGIELLRKVKAKSPHIVRMVLSARADLDSLLKAINDGEVFRFLAKPWNELELKSEVKQAFDHYHVCAENRRLTEVVIRQNQDLKQWNENLAREVEKQTSSIREKNDELERLNRQLEGNLVDTIKTFATLLGMRDPETCSHSRRVTQASRFIAARLGVSGGELRTIEIAAMLHDIGKIGVPDSILKKSTNLLSRMEREILQRHPVLGQDCVCSIGRLCDAGELIRHHHENFAGGGYPDRISGEKIPLGARIIAVADAYDRYVHSRSAVQPGQNDALKFLRARAGSMFDPAVVNALAPYMEEDEKKSSGSVETAIPISELREGMVLSKDIVTGSGILLIANGETLTQVYVEKIKNYARIDPSMSKAYIVQQGDAPHDEPGSDTCALEVGQHG